MTTQQPRTGTRTERVLARGILTAKDGCLSLARRYPLLADAALAALVLVLSVPPFTDLTGSRTALSLALVFAVAIPLIWRRRAPFLVFGIITAAALVQLFAAWDLTDYLAVLIAFYTVAAYTSPRRILAAAATLEAGATLAVARTSPTDSHAAWEWLLASGLVAAAGFLGYYVRTTRQARAATLRERSERSERDRDQQVQLAAAAERARIAREMHDIVAHNIAVMIALADGAACTAATSPIQAVDLMSEISATGRSALTEMRRLLGVLREAPAPGHAPQPTLDDLEDLLAAVRAAGAPVLMTVTGEPFPLPPSAQLAVYRMIQEALTNSLKHAPGASAHVRLTYQPGQIELEVTDEGHHSGRPATGPSGRELASGRQPDGGHGIAGMRERAAVFGGEVSAEPRPDGGWRVHTRLRLGPPRAGGGPVTEKVDA